MTIHEPEAGPTWAERAELDQLASVIDPLGNRTKNGLIDRVQKAALAQVLPAAGARTLDFGCGTGRLSGWLTAKGLDVDGVDASPEMIEQARRFEPGVRFAVSDKARLPFEDASFDITLSVMVLQYFTEDPQALAVALAELRRVTAPGGSVVVIEQAHDADLGRGTTLEGYVEAMNAAGLPTVHTRTIRRSDCRAQANALRFPLLAASPLAPRLILRDAARRAGEPLTGGRYADVLFVAPLPG